MDISTARSLGIPLRGTVGIILLAKKRSHIAKATPLIESLIDAGLRFDIVPITFGFKAIIDIAPYLCHLMAKTRGNNMKRFY